jgi:hypothetical protein
MAVGALAGIRPGRNLQLDDALHQLPLIAASTES